MRCPNPDCGSKITQVESVIVYMTFKHRNRMCKVCGTTFQTSETIMPGTVILCEYEPLQEQLSFFKHGKNKQKKNKLD